MSGNKKVINKSDLRRLMKEQTSSTKNNDKKVESPFAKYNALGQLWCTLCNCPVKTNLLWTAHIQGRTHKENVSKLKTDTVFVKPVLPLVSSSSPSSSSSLSGVKRKADSDDRDSKYVKGDTDNSSKNRELPADFFDSSSKSDRSLPSAQTTETTLKAARHSNDNDSRLPSQRLPVSLPSAGSNQLPADFFGSSAVEKVSSSDEQVASTSNITEQLPEGFFDDPKMDAKVRQVPFKDKMEEEWELFQKHMKEETMVSEALVEDDDEQREEERNIDEIDDQLNRWERVASLLKKREQIAAELNGQQNDDSDDSDILDVDMNDLNESTQWRSKGAWS